jgi:acetyltransferase-like isoleucine patch superfamily enzyme
MRVLFSWYKFFFKEKINNSINPNIFLNKNEINIFKHFGENSILPDQKIILNPKYISIGNNFKAMYNLRIEAWDEYKGEAFNPEIKIGENVIFNSDVHIGAIKNVTIGDNVLIASRVFISDHFHGDSSIEMMRIPPMNRPLFSKGPILIEKNVWIGEGVSILSGVTIGEGSIVGANSVVTKSFPPYSIIGGVPARLIK